MKQFIVTCIVMSGLFVVSGCGHPSTYQVTGTVTLKNGKPANGGWVTFQPEIESPINASAEIQADGTYKVGTFAPNDGALPGKHKVTVTPPSSEDGTIDGENYPAKYYNFKETPLEFTVESNDNNKFDIKLE